jgi:hypothetical protein
MSRTPRSCATSRLAALPMETTIEGRAVFSISAHSLPPNVIAPGASWRLASSSRKTPASRSVFLKETVPRGIVAVVLIRALDPAKTTKSPDGLSVIVAAYPSPRKMNSGPDDDFEGAVSCTGCVGSFGLPRTSRNRSHPSAPTSVFGVDSGWVQNSTLSTEDALAVVSKIAVRVDVAIESNGPHTEFRAKF